MLYFSSDVDACQTRNKNRKPPHWVSPSTIAKMATTMQPPDPKKFLWERNSKTIKIPKPPTLIQWNSVIDYGWMDSIYENIPKDVEAAERKEAIIKEKDRAATHKSVAHQADVAMRKCLGPRVKRLQDHFKDKKASDVKSRVKEAAKEMGEIRKGLLTRIRASKDEVSQLGSVAKIVDKVLVEYERIIDELVNKLMR